MGADNEQVATPTPSQSGMTSGCKKCHKGMSSVRMLGEGEIADMVQSA